MPFRERPAGRAVLVICAAIVFYAAINNLGEVWRAVKWVLDILAPVLIGFAVFFILSPFAGLIESAIRGSRRFSVSEKAARRLGVTAALLTVAAVLALVVVIIIPEIRKGSEKLADILPGEIERAVVAIDSLAERAGIDLELVSLGDIDWDKVRASAESLIPRGGQGLVSGLVGTLGSVLGVVFDLVIGTVIGVKIAIEKEAVGRFFRGAASALMGRERAEKLFRFVSLSREAFRGFMQGQLLEACSLSLLTFVGMLIFRFPFAAGVAAVMGLTALIPVFGAWIGAGFGTLMALTVSPARALFFLAFIISLQAIDNAFIYPRIVGNSMKLNGLLVLTAVTVGGAAFGFVGMLLSVPAASVLYTLVKEAAERRNAA